MPRKTVIKKLNGTVKQTILDTWQTRGIKKKGDHWLMNTFLFDGSI